MAKEKIVFKENRNTSPKNKGTASKIGNVLFLKSLLKNAKKGS
jgi:hypothetical protein